MTPNVGDTCFTTDQFSELRQLEKANIEVGGQGFRSELQALIIRITNANAIARVMDPRIAQAKKLWRKGWGTGARVQDVRRLPGDDLGNPGKPPRGQSHVPAPRSR